MKTLIKSLVATAALGTAAALAFAVQLPENELVSPPVNQPAPEFTVTDIEGKTHNLADFEGKVVVLEWFNRGCPFVVKHYGSDNMQSLQREFKETEEVVWITVVSSAEGKQGYMTVDETKAQMEEWNMEPSAVVLDKTGELGRLYGARTTPHMYVIDRDGTLVYKGGIDDINSTDPADIEPATPLAANAVRALLSGEAVEVNSSAPYGCSVKY
jgi:peroxiredoxin